jgi:hypothetical protein
LLAACIQVETVVQNATAGAPPVVFDAPIPDAPKSLTLYRSEPAPPIPSAVLSRLCNANDQKSRAAMLPAPPSAQVDGQPGEVECHPDFDALAADERPGPIDATKLLKVARASLLMDGVLPRDAGLPIVKRASVLRHVRVRRNSQTAPEAVESGQVLLYATAQRQLDGFLVDGPGSRSSLAIDAQGVNRGFTRSWRTALPTETLEATLEPTRVRAEIERQISALGRRHPARVQDVRLVYYDSNRTLIQPAYRFVVELGADPHSVGDTQHVVGYVAYAQTADPVPELRDDPLPAATQSPEPDATSPEPGATSPEAQAPRATPIEVGRYVGRNENLGWVRDARQFWESLATAGGSLRFNDSQVGSAAPEQFTTRSRDFIDSVDIALVEAHGAIWTFATHGKSSGLVDISSDVPPLGTTDAAGGGGRLRHWILHSCSVIPAPDDTPAWANAWWRVFGGLHSVVGYRTSMLVNDGAGAVLGRSLGLGGAVVPAWFSAVVSLNAYSLDPYGTFGCRRRVRPLGRPSAVSACGVANATASDALGQIESDCLDAWWIGDESL